ncbi:TetR/AcrR family transcriptional regulator [Rapidithrix thailandica]|uniref:TetR/AcrR family transcriptional regulator n=1 Tax=Rapidithrix thailandica TaxID=413964 RepID=A0AAW9S296_9BACT
MPRTEQQFAAIREKSKAKFLRTALELFANYGYHSTSISQIAKSAGVAKGSLYHYFESKEQLLEAVFMQGLNELDGLFEEIDMEAAPEDKLTQLLDLSISSLQKEKHFWQLYFALITQMKLPEVLRKRLQPVMNEMFTFFNILFQELGAEEPESEAKLLAATFDGICLHYLMMGEEYPLEKVKEKLLGMYIGKR